MNYDKRKHPNYLFLIEEARNTNGKNLLDFGCGKGDIVNIALGEGFNALGVEYFGPGSGTKINSELKKRGLLGKKVFEYDGVSLPFDDESFDIVLSNQVFEHIPDLEVAIKEIARVLRPGGRLICIFPYQGAFREGHSNTLFTHWLPQSRIRYLWLKIFRLFGIGRLKGNRGISGWALFFNGWLTENTFYRSWSDIENIFNTHFSDLTGRELEYLAFRMRLRKAYRMATIIRNPLFQTPSRWICRKFGSLVLTATR